MDEWRDCEALDQFFDKIMGAGLDQKVKKSKQALWAISKNGEKGVYQNIRE